MPGPIERPDWLSESYLKDIYRDRSEFKGGECVLEIVKCSGVVEIGDNYLSKMYRVGVKVSNGRDVTVEENLIVKSMESTNPMMSEMGIFTVEAQMYKVLLPAFEALWKEAGVNIRFGPKYLKMDTKPHEVLILSDLNDDKYFMEDRFQKLGLKHAEVTLAKLARFHAASVSYREKNKSFGAEVDNRILPAMFMEANHNSFVVALENMGINQAILTKIRKWPETAMEEWYRISNTDNPDDLHVLAHGDAHINNLLYRRDKDGQPDDIIFIDYQLACYGNPITDIFYFLFTSVKPEVMVAHFDYLIFCYHSHLVEAFATLKIQQKAPSLKEFHLYIMQNGYCATSLFTEIIPAMVMERHAGANLDGFIGDPNSEASKTFRDKMYNNPRFEATVKVLLPFLDNRGFLESGMKKGDLPEVAKQKLQEFEAKFAKFMPQSEPKPTKGASKPESPQQTNGTNDSMPAKTKITKRIADSIDQLTRANSQNESKIAFNGSSTPNDKGSPPTWLDKFYFYDILRKDHKSFRVVTFNIGPANKKGENYASAMFRVRIKIETSDNGRIQDCDYVVKVNPDKGAGGDFTEMINVFPKEIQMYDTIIPAFEDLYRKVGEPVQFGPRCVLGGKDPAYIIILEDLKAKGYVNSNRRELLDLKHCELTLEKLAKFHAASAVYLANVGTLPKEYDQGIHSEQMRPILEQSYAMMSSEIMEIFKTWKCGHILTKVYGNWKQNLMDKVYQVVKRDDKRFNVLCHGDMWCNNVMFKYDEAGQPVDCLLVDYQMCNHNSPVIDLLYFIFTSPKQSLKLSHIDHFLQFYHTHLVANLKRLGYQKPLPTLLQLHVEFLEKGFYGYDSAFGTFAIVVAEAGDDSNIEMFFMADEEGKKFRNRVYTNPIFVNAMEEIVPYFARKGYFE